MRTITRDNAIACIAIRPLYIANARDRQDLKALANVGRVDLDFLWEQGLITSAEKIQHECQLSRAVQAKLADLMPLRLVVGGRS